MVILRHSHQFHQVSLRCTDARPNWITLAQCCISYIAYITYDMTHESHDTVLYFNCFCVNQPKSICKQNDLISFSFYFDLKNWTFHKWIIIQNYDHALFYKRDSAWITWFSIIYFKQNQLNWVKLDFMMMKIPQKRCIPSFRKIQFFSYKVTGLNSVLIKEIYWKKFWLEFRYFSNYMGNLTRKYTNCTVYLVSHCPSETEGALVMKGFNDNFMISGLDLLENP